MLNNISIGSYIETKSNIHDMHPLSKIICTIAFICMALFTNDLEISMVLTLLVMVMVVNTNLPLSVYYSSVKSIFPLLLFVFLFFSLLSLSFAFGFVIFVNLILITIYLSILTLTTPPTEIIYGLEKFFYPLNKVNIKVNMLAVNVGVSLKFIPTFIGEVNNVYRSMASRGIDRYSSFNSLCSTFFVAILASWFKSLSRLKSLKEMMFLRLYGYERTRTNFRINNWGIFDSYLLVIHIAIMGVIIWEGVIL